MSSVVAAGRRVLPRGWRDFGLQLGIWFGFVFAYQLARGIADRNPAKAFTNGHRIFALEEHLSHRLYELTFEHFVDQRFWLAKIVSLTYWNSEFTVLGLTLLFVYLRRHEAFTRFRNSILLANLLGLFGYVFMPTAPPRLLHIGFVNDHRDGLVQLMANPYAAMPSLHAGDSLIVGVVLFTLCRRWWSKLFWALWPAWVWFVVMATGNHFWVDCVAGVVVALVAMTVVYRVPVRQFAAAHRP